MTESISTKLEQRLPGFKASFGGEELKRATSALSAGVEPPHEALKEARASGSGEPLLSTTPSGFILISPTLAQSTPDSAENDLALRELALAANQYSKAQAVAGPSGQDNDYDTAYHHGLLLQELASKLHAGPAEQLKLLQQACELYSSAAAARPSSHALLYNWGVALSDMARLLKEAQPGESLSYLRQASHKYAGSLALQPGSPQALNNWGLVLQEMSSLTQLASERDQLVSYALEKFRHAVRLRPDFDRGCYNLGTVLYTYACALQAELAAQLKAGRLTSQDTETSKERHGREARARDLFTSAAQYICLAAALQPSKEIYRRSLAVVKPLLPLPFLRAGYLTAPLEHTLGGPEEMWRREWFVVDHSSIRSASALESSLSSAASGALAGSAPMLRIGHAVGEVPLEIPLDAILTVRRCYDPSLPEGEALWLQLARPLKAGGRASHPHACLSTTSVRQVQEQWPEVDGAVSATAIAGAEAGQQIPDGDTAPKGGGCVEGFYGLVAPSCAPPCSCVWLIADDADCADAWADALMLAHHVAASRSPEALAEVLTPAVSSVAGATRASGGGGPDTAGGLGGGQRV